MARVILVVWALALALGVSAAHPVPDPGSAPPAAPQTASRAAASRR